MRNKARTQSEYPKISCMGLPGNEMTHTTNAAEATPMALIGNVVRPADRVAATPTTIGVRTRKQSAVIRPALDCPEGMTAETATSSNNVSGYRSDESTEVLVGSVFPRAVLCLGRRICTEAYSAHGCGAKIWTSTVSCSRKLRSRNAYPLHPQRLPHEFLITTPT
jgi:hypothetical protein